MTACSVGQIVVSDIVVVLVRKKRQITISRLLAVFAPTLTISFSYLLPLWSDIPRLL